MATAYATRSPRSVLYRDWKGPIQMAMDLDQLVKVVQAYLGAWQVEQLRALPPEVSAAPLHNSEAVFARAVVASHAELKCPDDTLAHTLLREMALTLSAASVRLRHLQAIRCSL